MKKFLALMALLLCFTMVFVACGDDPVETNPEQPTESVSQSTPDSEPESESDSEPVSTPDTAPDTAPDSEPDTTPDSESDSEPVVDYNYGTLENPVTPTYVLEACAGLANQANAPEKFYVQGTVTAIGSTGNYYQNVYVSDGTSELLIYSINLGEGIDGFEVGDTIIAYGYVKNYNGTIEMAGVNKDYPYALVVVPGEGADTESDSVTESEPDSETETDPVVVPPVEPGAGDNLDPKDFVLGETVLDFSASNSVWFTYVAEADGLFVVDNANADVTVALYGIDGITYEGNAVVVSAGDMLTINFQFTGEDAAAVLPVYTQIADAGSELYPFDLVIGLNATPAFVAGTDLANPGITSYAYSFTATEACKLYIDTFANISVFVNGVISDSYDVELVEGDVLEVIVYADYDEDMNLITAGVNFSVEYAIVLTPGFNMTPEFVAGTGLDNPGINVWHYIYTATEAGKLFVGEIDNISVFVNGVISDTYTIVVEEGDVVELYVYANYDEDFNLITDGIFFDASFAYVGSPEYPFDLIVNDWNTTPEFVAGTSMMDPGKQEYAFIWTADAAGKIVITPVAENIILVVNGEWYMDGSADVVVGDVVEIHVQAAWDENWNMVTDAIWFGVELAPEGSQNNPFDLVFGTPEYTTPEFVAGTGLDNPGVQEYWYSYTVSGGATLNIEWLENITVMVNGEWLSTDVTEATLVDGDVVEVVVYALMDADYHALTTPVTFKVSVNCTHADAVITDLEDGTHAIKCPACGNVIGEATAHVFGEYTYNNDATCTVNGTKTATCECGKVDTVADADHVASGHTWAGTQNCQTCGQFAYPESFMTMEEAFNFFDGTNYYYDGNPADGYKSSYSLDGYVLPGQNNWFMTGYKEDNPAANGYRYDGTPIKIASNATMLDFNLYGWARYGSVNGSISIDSLGCFVDGIESADEVVYNTTPEINLHMDMMNDTNGPLGLHTGQNYHADIQPGFGNNARRFCFAFYRTTPYIWDKIKDEPGVHTLYVIAKMKDGQEVVFLTVQIEVVDHECTFPADGTQGVGTVTAPTCTADGYTTVGCTAGCNLCPATVIINRVDALGHIAADEYTFFNGTHYKKCTGPNCDYKFDEGTCSGADGINCDTCGGCYGCNHNYIVNATNGALMCTECENVIATPKTFFSGKDIVDMANSGGFGNYTPTLGEDGAAIVTGVGNADGAITISLAGVHGQYIAIVYKTTANHEIWYCHYNPGHTPVSMTAGNSWHVTAAVAAQCIHGRNDIRLNIGADAVTEIAYFASFDNQQDWIAYVNDSNTYVLPSLPCEHEYKADITTGEIACTKCDKQIDLLEDPSTYLSSGILAQGNQAATANVAVKDEYVTMVNAQNQWAVANMQQYVVLQYRTEAGSALTYFTMCYYDARTNATHLLAIENPYVTDGEWHTMIIDMKCANDVDGNTDGLNSIFMIQVDNAGKGGSVDVARLATFTSLDGAQAYADALANVTIAE